LQHDVALEVEQLRLGVELALCAAMVSSERSSISTLARMPFGRPCRAGQVLASVLAALVGAVVRGEPGKMRASMVIWCRRRPVVDLERQPESTRRMNTESATIASIATITAAGMIQRSSRTRALWRAARAKRRCICVS